MNRKIRFTLMSLLILIISVAPCFGATQNNASIETIYYNDGSYAIITTTIQDTSIQTLNRITANSTSKNASKTYILHDQNGKKVASFTVDGTFTYDGTTAKAIRSSCSASTNSGWTCTQKTSKCSGATVTGNATFSLDGVSKKATVKLTCSANGSIS